MYFLLRVARKLSHLAHIFLRKSSAFAARIEDKATRLMLGTDFSVKVRDQITVEEKLYTAIKFITPLNPSLPAVGRSPKVTLLVPSLVERGFYGGVATALIFAAKLALHRSLPLRIVQTAEPGDGKGLETFFRHHDISLPASQVEIVDVSGRRFNVYGYLEIHPQDIFIASAWWDAHLLSKLPLLHKYVYLLQDYEPIFYPNGDEAVLAENTYHGTNFVPVCNTKLMHEYLSSEGYEHIKEHGVWFEPAVAWLKTSRSRPATGKKRLFLYGRPGVARNLFHLSLQALNEAFGEDKLEAKDWEIVMAGQDNIPNIRLTNGVVIENLGKLSMADYLELLTTVDVALSPMMAPHPNYPTLEMASVGAAVVTTQYKTKKSLSHYSKNIIMAGLSVASLTEGLIKAGRLTYNERMDNLSHNHIPTDWDEQFEVAFAAIDKAIPRS
jgi:hypothetical protein